MGQMIDEEGTPGLTAKPAQGPGGEDDEIEVYVSALEHFSYCPRQCGLIHLEQTFEENVFTARGRVTHERVDSEDAASVAGIPAARGVAVWSTRFRLRGKLDLLEFRPEGPYPVEYKSGRREGAHADLQLCAQAICLDEMLGVAIPRGALYYHATRKRHEVMFDDGLRDRTIAVIEAVRAMMKTGRLPPPVFDARCPNCSLKDACLPRVVTTPARLRGLQGALFQPLPLAAGDELE
ncbi:MAG: CRISPR-associated protein Cas4 [Anaerolineae bacterium]